MVLALFTLSTPTPAVMHTSFAALTATLLAASSLAQAPTEKTYVREADGWIRIDDGQRYRIDPSVVTVRFQAPIADLAGFRSAALAAGVSNELFASLATIRTNRLGIHDLSLPADVDVLDAVAAIRSTGLVEFCDETCLGTYVVDPNDPQYPSLWNWKNTGQSGGTVDADVDADLAWDLERGDPSVTIAVIDSGTEITHPDLAANVWTNVDEIPNNGVDDDNNGFVDDVQGWDFENNDNNPASGFFHGTFVAGMCCAVGNNGTQVIGLAGGFGPGEGCSVLAEGIGQFFPIGSVLDDAIIYAVDNGARIITLSLSVGFDNAIENAIAYGRRERRLHPERGRQLGRGWRRLPGHEPDGGGDRRDDGRRHARELLEHRPGGLRRRPGRQRHVARPRWRHDRQQRDLVRLADRRRPGGTPDLRHADAVAGRRQADPDGDGRGQGSGRLRQRVRLGPHQRARRAGAPTGLGLQRPTASTTGRRSRRASRPTAT